MKGPLRCAPSAVPASNTTSSASTDSSVTLCDAGMHMRAAAHTAEIASATKGTYLCEAESDRRSSVAVEGEQMRELATAIPLARRRRRFRRVRQATEWIRVDGSHRAAKASGSTTKGGFGAFPHDAHPQRIDATPR